MAANGSGKERPEEKVWTWAHFQAWLDSPEGQRYLELTRQDRAAVEADRCRGMQQLQRRAGGSSSTGGGAIHG